MAINKIKFEQLDINFTGLVFSGTSGYYVNTGAFSNFTGQALTSSSFASRLPLFQTGNQFVSGVKNFFSRPTLSGSGLALTGEGVQLAGAQTIVGKKTFSGGLQIGPPGLNASVEILNQKDANRVLVNDSLISFTGNSNFEFDNSSLNNLTQALSQRFLISTGVSQTISGNKTFASSVTFTGGTVNFSSSRPNVTGFPVALATDLTNNANGTINVSGLGGVDFRVKGTNTPQQNLIANYSLTAQLANLGSYFVSAPNFFGNGLYFFNGETGGSFNDPGSLKSNFFTFDPNSEVMFAIETIASPATGKQAAGFANAGNVTLGEVFSGVECVKLRAGRNKRLEIMGSSGKNGSILIKFDERPHYAFVTSGQYLYYRTSNNFANSWPLFEQSGFSSWTGIYSGTGYTSTGVGLIVISGSQVTGLWSGLTGAGPDARARIGAFVPLAFNTGDVVANASLGTGLLGEFSVSNLGNKSLGLPHIPWGQICGVTNTINISDRKQKTLISNVSDDWLDAWGELNYSQFKFIDSVKEKGSGNARWHIGLIAQDVDEAFKKKNLDAFEIGIIGKDYTPPVINEDNIMTFPPTEVWSIRPDECQFMELAYLRREINKLKSGLSV